MESFQAERTELAAALRWAARLGFQEGVDNHFSVAVDPAGEKFLVNPYGMLWSEVTASSLVLCDPDGPLDRAQEVESTAFFIHSPLHRTAPHATAVLHTHMPYTTALTLIDGGRLEPCQQNALLFTDRIAYDDSYNGLALDSSEGLRTAAALGASNVLMLGGHGVMVTGATVAEALADLFYLECAAKAQVLAMSTGLPLRRIPDDVVRHTFDQAKTELPLVAQRYFAAVLRTLDREEPEYRS